MILDIISSALVGSTITASSNLRIGKGFCPNADIHLHCEADTNNITWTTTYTGTSDVLFLFRPAFIHRTLQDHEFLASYFPNGNESFLFYGNATTNYTINCNRESFDVTILNGEFSFYGWIFKHSERWGREKALVRKTKTFLVVLTLK